MKKFVLLSFLLLGTASLNAQDSNIPKVKIGGIFYLMGHYDSYKSVENRDGVSYSYPLAPNIDSDGNDINQAGQFNLSAYATRLNIEAAAFKLLEADARVYVEVDFMGSSSDFLQMIRLRHAYLDLQWEKDELLFGQTNNLEYPSEVVSGVLTAGAGSPIAILSRPTQVRYGRALGNNWKVYAALSYHHVQASDSSDPQTKNANRNSGMPSAEARIQFGSTNRFFFGVSGGWKLLRPRLETSGGLEATEKISSASATAFLRWNINGHTFKAQGVYGSNLSHLGMIGGYAKQADLMEEGMDYDYSLTNFLATSVWADFETKAYKHFQLGIFGGYMENLGTGKEIDRTIVCARNANLHYTGRVSPRITWSKEKFLLGLEYSIFWAKWGKTFDEHYLPIESYKTTYNNRVTMLVRYTF